MYILLTTHTKSIVQIHSLLAHLASGVDYSHGLEQLILIGFDQDGRVHLLHSLLSVLVDIYSAL